MINKAVPPPEDSLSGQRAGWGREDEMMATEDCQPTVAEIWATGGS
jgi:hypothetical protein